MSITLIAVYGTLLTGERNFRIGASALSRRPCTLQGTLFDTGFGYPAFVPAPSTAPAPPSSSPGLRAGTPVGQAPVASAVPVSAELLEVDDATLALLDRLEGVPTLYRRRDTVATLPDGSDLPCQVYVMNRLPSRATRIPSGDWRTWRRRT